MKIKQYLVFIFILCTTTLCCQVILNRSEVYNFNINDEFQSLRWNIHPIYRDTFHRINRIIILQKEVSELSIKYNQEEYIYDVLNIDFPPYELKERGHAKWDIEYFTSDSFLIPNVIFDTIYYDNEIYNGRKIYHIDHYAVNGTSSLTYADGCGLVNHTFSDSLSTYRDSLIYYKKGNEIWGQEAIYSAPNIISFDGRMLIYPNPTKNELNIEIDKSQDAQDPKIEVFSNLGSLVLEIEVEGYHAQIDCSKFPVGLYFITASSDSWKATRKFIKK